MYQQYWGLTDAPFASGVHLRCFHQAPPQEEVLARLHFLVEHRRRLGLLVGERGSGKSLVLEAFASQSRREGRQVALVNLLGLDDRELVWTLAEQFGRNPSTDDSVLALWQAVTDQVIENRYQQIETVVLLDDADEAASAVVTQITRLLQSSAIQDAPLTIVLAAGTQGYRRLGRRLLDQCELRLELDPWDEADTADFLRASLAAVGRPTPVFDSAAVIRLHELAGGMPRRVQQLAQLSLVAGAGQELNQVDAQTVEDVYEELDVSAFTLQ